MGTDSFAPLRHPRERHVESGVLVPRRDSDDLVRQVAVLRRLGSSFLLHVQDQDNDPI